MPISKPKFEMAVTFSIKRLVNLFFIFAIRLIYSKFVCKVSKQ